MLQGDPLNLMLKFGFLAMWELLKYFAKYYSVGWVFYIGNSYEIKLALLKNYT